MAGKILVTGASGLVGANLVRELVRRGEQVRVLLRKNSNTRAIIDLPKSQLQIAYGDITQPDSVRAAMEGVSTVYHSAAAVTMWHKNVDWMRRINVEGTRNMLDAALQARADRFIMVSSVDAIGFPEDKTPSNETTPYANDKFGLPYFTTKHEAQRLALSYVPKGLDVVVVNPTFMLGPWDLKPSSGQMILEVASGKVLAYPGGGNNFVHIQDVVEAMIAARERGKTGELYILGNENLTYCQVLTKMARALGAKPPKRELPRWIAISGGYAAAAWGTVTRKPLEVNHKVAAVGYVYHWFDSSKARRELGLKSTPVEQAIVDAVRWFRDNEYIKA